MINLINLNAYIDPQVATYLISSLAGVAIAAGVTIGIYRRRIVAYFRNLKIKRLEKKLEKKTEKMESAEKSGIVDKRKPQSNK